MECGSTKFLVGLGIGSAIGALVYHFSRTAKAKKLKNDVFNALREIEADAETAMEDAKAKAVKAGVSSCLLLSTSTCILSCSIIITSCL